MKIYNYKTPDMTIELTPDDKWWVKLLIEKAGIDLENNKSIEIEFFEDKGYYYPALLFDKEQVDWIEEYSIDEVKEIINSKSRVRKRFHFEIIEEELL